ncbi:MAG: hypothetical protein NTY80_01580 [candidate division SR1 bacterium]|nr:hypothetical protein [candidate division SR1 bacterium]
MTAERKETEISVGGEIFSNERYKELPALNDIISGNKEVLGKLLSLRVPLGERTFPHDTMPQYNIETEKYITNITGHNGLDLLLSQYNKQTKKTEVYTPYSNPGYGVYANVLCAYYEIFKKRPILNFENRDIVGWNELGMHNPFMGEMMNSYQSVADYIHNYEYFKQDNEGIHRIIREENSGRTEDGFGIYKDEAILQFTDDFESGQTTRFCIEKELLNLFIQSFIEVNARFGGPRNNLNLKKIADVVYTVLENPELRKDVPGETLGKLRREKFK